MRTESKDSFFGSVAESVGKKREKRLFDFDRRAARAVCNRLRAMIDWKSAAGSLCRGGESWGASSMHRDA